MISELIGWGIGAFGEKPEEQQLAHLNFGKLQADTVNQNLQNFGAISGLADKYNTFNADQMSKYLESIAPGYGAMQSKGRDVIMSELNGELPPDLANRVAQHAAEHAMGGGYGGSGMAHNLEARDFGLTSFNMTQQGLDSAQKWMAQAQSSTSKMFDISSMFTTPEMRFGYEERYNRDRLSLDTYNANIRAAPEPWAAAMYAGMRQDESNAQQAIASMASSYMGGMGGGKK